MAQTHIWPADFHMELSPVKLKVFVGLKLKIDATLPHIVSSLFHDSMLKHISVICQSTNKNSVFHSWTSCGVQIQMGWNQVISSRGLELFN